LNNLTLIPNVRKWLDEQGYPLEMRAAAAFRKAGFEVRQSTVYTDPDTTKSREIDVEADDPDYRGVVNIRFVLECKAGGNPWVLLCSHDTVSNYNRAFAFAASSVNGRHQLIDAMSRDFAAFFARIPWADKNGLVGYSLRQAHSQKDTAFEAAVSVSKACNAFIQEYEAKRSPWLGFAFPVIVVESPLIRCWLTSDGEIQMEETSEGEFLFLPNFGACIRVITANHLPTFATEAKRVAGELREEFKSYEEDALEALKRGPTRRIRLSE
jgi:hypothetical protein